MPTTSQRVAVETSFTYDVETDRYICSDGKSYTFDELDALDRIQKEWERTNQPLTFTQWVELFADEKPGIAKVLSAKHKRLGKTLKALDALLTERSEQIQRAYTAAPSTELYKKSKERIALIEELIAERKKVLKKEIAIVQSHHDQVSGNEPKVGRVDDHLIGRAREYPIISLIKVGRDHKALCPFHSDTKPSLHVYPDGHAYCFVCGKRASTIDIYMAIHSCDFKTAVKALTA